MGLRVPERPVTPGAAPELLARILARIALDQALDQMAATVAAINKNGFFKRKGKK